MRDVVVVGAGLTGLVAATQLSSVDINVTLIEVKRHLGGSLQTIEQSGSLLDAGAFAIEESLDAAWLAELGLDEALIPLSDGCIAFEKGTQQVVDALASKMTATRLMRMAVSSIGELDNGRYSICMENGLMFDARALILAVPARYAERMFYGYITPITELLLDYHYDAVQRVSVVCETTALPEEIITPPDMAYPFIHWTTHASRVPEGYTLLQFGMRIDREHCPTDEALLDFVVAQYGLPQPIASHVGYWAEADPISCYDDAHADRVAQIRAQLPDGIALVGSDYALTQAPMPGVTRFNERIAQGMAAAEQVLATL